MKNLKNKKIVVLIAIIAAIIIVWTYNSNNTKTDTATPIKIGVIAPLSGQYGALGESIRDAIILGTEGESDIQVVFEDGQFDSKVSLSAYQKLVNVDNVDVVLNVVSPSMSAIQPLVDESKLLTFHLTESDYKADDTVFQIMPFSYPIFSALATEASKRYDRIALVYGGDIDIFKTNAEFFKQGISSDKIVHEVAVSGTSDMRTEVSKVLESNPDAMTVIVDKESGIKLLKALRDQMGDRDVDVICDANMEFVAGDFIEALGGDELLDGCISSNLPNNTTSDFKLAFAERFGYEPLPFSDYAFDAVSIVKDLRTVAKEDWVKEVQKIDMNGVSGPISFDNNGTRLEAYELKIFQDGQFVKLEN